MTWSEPTPKGSSQIIQTKHTPWFASSPSAPRNDGVGTAPRNDGVGTAPRNDGVGTAPRNDGVGTAPRNDGMGTAPRNDGVGTAPRNDGVGTAPRNDGVGRLLAITAFFSRHGLSSVSPLGLLRRCWISRPLQVPE